jgi:hypothetical protein
MPYRLFSVASALAHAQQKLGQYCLRIAADVSVGFDRINMGAR